MMNNNNYDNDNDNDYNAITYVFIGLFSLLLLVIICFCVFAYFTWFKSKYTNNTIYTYEKKIIINKKSIYKMNDNIRELKIDSTLWATPAKIINLLDFKPEKLSIKTEINNYKSTSSKI